MDLAKFESESLGSPFADQLRRGFSRLRFAEPLEKDFREFYVAQNLPRARLSGLIALVLVLAITCIDLVFGTPATGKLNALHLGVLCPLLLLLAAAVSLPIARRYYTEIVSVGVTLAGFVVTYITHTAALAGASYVLAGLVLVVLFGCLFLGLLFNVSIAVAALLIGAHFLSGLALGLPFDMLSYMTAILG